MSPSTPKYGFRCRHMRLATITLIAGMATACSLQNNDAQPGSSGSSAGEPAASADTHGVKPTLIAVQADLESAQRLPDVPVADLYASLRNRADAGDLEAKRQLFLVLNECRVAMQPDRPIDYSSSQVSPDLLKASGKTREQFLADQQLKSLSSAEEKLKRCEAIPRDALKDTARWLKEAAEGGDTYARLAYYNYLDLVVGDQRTQEASPEKVEEFNTDSFRYLKSVADAGSADGLFSLGTAYQRGIITPKDPVRAYAYKKAAGELTPIGGNAQAVDLMARSMTPSELEQANELAILLAQRSGKWRPG
ncbi:hypothetical protein WAB97_016860 [Stenotrophomonas maltophilia]|uniref:hypothetical protein n=1 Tax=Stenotrophomonas maltophilia TaxID=40324 RepID=UPI00331A7025